MQIIESKSNVIPFQVPVTEGFKPTIKDSLQRRRAVKEQFVQDCAAAFDIPAKLAEDLFEELAHGTFSNISINY